MNIVMNYLQRLCVILVAALLSILGLSLGSPVGAVAAPVNYGVQSAVNYASAQGVRVGITVLDEKTGAVYEAGGYNSLFGSASVMKLFVATKLLATGQMTGWKASTAYRMITQSDDSSLEALLPYVGGTSVVSWTSSYYHIPGLGTPSSKSWCWGNTHITPRGVAYFYKAMQSDPRVGPWLVNAIHHYSAYGSDGTDQRFGIPSATSGAGVKQGWGHCSADSGGSIVNTTGITNGNRFAVAILTETTRGGVNSNAFNAWQAAVVTNIARMVLPGGTINVPEGHNPIGHVDAVTVASRIASISGWALDPDVPNSAMSVRVYDLNTLRWNHGTTVPRADVNHVYRVTGIHGYSATFSLSAGHHTLCVMLMNVSYGTTNPKTCYNVNVS